ncbi:aminotransferase class I/II-fold pyridoxal phosphate-dependent enzyme [Tranquillimonas alkanivorans]|uniref:Aminotransferase n=1 Tax=Tranquillimonas alkanivorans TaxID=441119 RepID=A0A1I5KN99_9RHOB|nr:aminotransferase class I/II-fold pyridoxal phosphate-dependent enzyme [Tranquillimonas alkanivorans]SFO86146.1 L-threonine O-3-phosphate decarboxylase [Tranquillimonas alkanivorans]
MSAPRDHGGGLDAAAARWGGIRGDWLDLSTGINPVPYPVAEIPTEAWTALPDRTAQERLITAARRFWYVPDGAAVVAAPGASALIARLPAAADAPRVHIPGPTYNEHAAAFRAAGADVEAGEDAPVHVYVHPNNPDGRLWEGAHIGGRPLTVIDESFCDVTPGESHVARAAEPGVVVLKSFGKFWGLAGLRLGFAIAAPETAERLVEMLGPWPVSGPALEIGARALEDEGWARTRRARLCEDAARLDALLTGCGARTVGGTTLFRLYDVDDAAAWQERLAQGRVWTRVFPYSRHWLRLGLPHPDRWEQLEAAL